MVEPVYLMNGNTTSNVTVQSLLPAGDEVALPSLLVAMASGALDASDAVGVEPSTLKSEPSTSELSDKGLQYTISHADVPDEADVPANVMMTETAILDASGAVGVEPSTFKSEPGTSSDERLQYTISDVLDGGDSVPATVMTTETTMPIANKGRKHKGHGQGPTLKTNTTRQGTRMKKDITASLQEKSWRPGSCH